MSTETRALLSLLQLTSPALPVGAFSYSQGLEAVVEAGLIHDSASAQAWIFDSAEWVSGRFELPIWCRLHSAFAGGDAERIAHWNELFIAARDTRESRDETLQMGHSLRLLIAQLELPTPTLNAIDGPIAYPTAHAAACVALTVNQSAGAAAYLFASIENQAIAALKSVPLGQSAMQRLLLAAQPLIERTAQRAQQMKDEELCSSAPLWSVNSARHETQYSRLFRS